jgi:hypothetical protein
VVPSKTKQQKGGQQGGAAVRHLMKICQNDCENGIFYVMSEVQKDLKDVSAGIGIFLYPIHKNLVRNLTSKLARSTLTSASTIKVIKHISPLIMQYLKLISLNFMHI